VFRVSPDSGVLKPLGDPPSCKQLLQISFTARYSLPYLILVIENSRNVSYSAMNEVRPQLRVSLKFKVQE